jgi:hypothetical protein
MAKGLRLSEKWFRRGLWLVAFIFAGFLIGLGGNIVNDLPKVETRISNENFIDKPAADKLRGEIENLQGQLSSENDARSQTQLRLETARNDTRAERETFNNWLSTRGATQRSEQDPELIRRTQSLDKLKQNERDAERELEKFDKSRLEAQQNLNQAQSQLQVLTDESYKGYHAELRKQELRVFLYRLLLTLPLLVLGVWLFIKKRKSTYWPFVWGFIFFALFAFFVELVPYLPSYGGYVRYIVGLVLTVLAGRYAILALNRYLEKQKQAELQPAEKRREELSYDLVLARISKKACPGCERPYDYANQENNFCTHCGISVFDICKKCATRKSSFAHYCHACGTTAQA